MPRAYEWYTRGLHGTSVLVGVLAAAIAGCDPSDSSAGDWPSNPQSAVVEPTDAGTQPAQAAAPTSGDAGAPPLAPAQSDCAAHSCIGNSAQLADYCEEPFARCPVDIAAARTLACANQNADSVMQFQSSCGGAGIRIAYSYGMLDYHYDSAGALTAVTTFLFKTSQACESDAYLYGDSSCRAGAMEPVTCTP